MDTWLCELRATREFLLMNVLYEAHTAANVASDK